METPSVVSMSLSGQVALVTGGGTGIGYMIAKGFVDSGAKVYITGRREQVLKDAAAFLSGGVVPLVMDVTSQQSIDNAVKVVEDAEGKLDILVNNAGSVGPTVSEPDYLKKKMAHLKSGGDPLVLESFEGWAEVFALNTSGPFFIATSFQSLLTKGAEARRATSSIINISSIAADVRTWNPIVSFAFKLAKSAQDTMTVGLATDYAKRKVPIRVNAIHPGAFPSELATPDMMPKGFILPGFVAPIPLDRPGEPTEMAQTAVYLATSQYTNGVMLRLDGGLTLVNP